VGDRAGRGDGAARRRARARGARAGWRPGLALAWGIELALALAITAVALPLKARATGEDALSGPAWRFFTSFLVPALVTPPLTFGLARAGAWDVVPGAWLALYGCALVAGWGGLTREVVPRMGLVFVALGAAALLTPATWGDTWLGLGFGGVHVFFGLLIARRYGG
jgi:hypothetical protein